MNKFLLFTSLSILLFTSGCSTKRVFEPKVVESDWSHYGDAKEKIIDVGSNAALLEDRTLLSKDGILNVKIAKNSRVLSQSNGWILSATIDGHLTLTNIKDATQKIEFDLKKTIATASVKENTLAVVFADNEIALYDLETKELTFQEKEGKSLAIDSRIATPYFMKDLVLFPTLDGKVVVVNSRLKKRLRTVIVSSKDRFNNVIYFNVVDEKIIAVTATEMLSLSSKEKRAKYEIRDVVYDGRTLYITTKQGEVIALTSDLEVKSKIKFPFAHFLSFIAHNDKLYLLEKEGYMIVLDKDMKNYSVHEVDIEEGYLFVDGEKFYIADEYISVE